MTLRDLQGRILVKDADDWDDGPGDDEEDDDEAFCPTCGQSYRRPSFGKLCKHSPKGADGRFVSHTTTKAVPEPDSIHATDSIAWRATCKNCGKDIQASSRNGRQWVHKSTGRPCAVEKMAEIRGVDNKEVF